jgi:hypothetical protein
MYVLEDILLRDRYLARQRLRRTVRWTIQSLFRVDELSSLTSLVAQVESVIEGHQIIRDALAEALALLCGNTTADAATTVFDEDEVLNLLALLVQKHTTSTKVHNVTLTDTDDGADSGALDVLACCSWETCTGCGHEGPDVSIRVSFYSLIL